MTLTARDIHDIFPSNLRRLVSQSGHSVAEISRATGINRTQLNRYLSGDSSPRPEVLYRICAHFGVDARILLEPLHQIDDHNSAPQSPYRSIEEFAFGRADYWSLSHPPPLGIHRYWQVSSLNPDWVNCYLIRLFELDGATVFRALSAPVLDGFGATDCPIEPRREVRGVLTNQVDGLVIHAYLQKGLRISFSFLTHPVLTERPIYPGVVMVGRPVEPNVRRIVRCAFEVVPQDHRMRSILRGSQGQRLDGLDGYLRDILTREVS